jgi:hypothetical protein
LEHLFVVNQDKADRAKLTSLPECGLTERQHLQEWIIAHPDILGEDILVVTAEYDRWEAEADGKPESDRLDVLGIDDTGRLVVVELKRDASGRNVHLQAITYAALVSRFDLGSLAEAHRLFHKKHGNVLEIDDCRDRILAHVGGDLDQEILRRPRLVLVAREFPKQVTHTAVWLSEMGLDIDLVQVSLWRVGEQLVAGFTKIYPTPQAEEFTLAPAREETNAVAKRVQERSRAKNVVHRIVEAGVLPAGTRLRMEASHGTTQAIRDSIAAWVSEDPTRGKATWTNVTPKTLTWDADGADYTTTGLANMVYTTVQGSRPSGIQGTAWWVVEEEVPAGVDPADWAKYSGKTLVDIAKFLPEQLDVGSENIAAHSPPSTDSLPSV